MNRFGAALGLVAILLQQPMVAQRANNQDQSRQAKQDQDVEFIRLYQQVSELEQKLANDSPKTGTIAYYIDGKEVLAKPNLDFVIFQGKQDQIAKLASRYGIEFNLDESGIFTWGNSLVIEKSFQDYVIFDQFSATIAKSSWSERPRIRHYYSYEVLRAVRDSSSVFKILSHGEVADGVIPILETQDFYGIASKIRQLTNDYRSTYQYGRIQLFAIEQLNNIGGMLINNIEDSALDGLPLPDINGYNDIPRVRGNRILLYGSAYEDNGGILGEVSLSIAPNGTVEYWYRKFCCFESQTPIHRTPKIDFSKIK